jgi:hypothetical protein
VIVTILTPPKLLHSSSPVSPSLLHSDTHSLLNSGYQQLSLKLASAAFPSLVLSSLAENLPKMRWYRNVDCLHLYICHAVSPKHSSKPRHQHILSNLLLHISLQRLKLLRSLRLYNVPNPAILPVQSLLMKNLSLFLLNLSFIGLSPLWQLLPRKLAHPRANLIQMLTLILVKKKTKSSKI